MQMAKEFVSDLPLSTSSSQIQREPIRHVLYGSKVAIIRTISILHVKGYAETFEWSKPLPTETPGTYMSILSRLLLME